MRNPTTTPIQVATAGEALVDLLMQGDGRFYPALGGSVFNLTRALARQGITTAYLNPLSQDWFGQRFCNTLQEDGATLAHPVPATQPTSLAVVQTSPRGQPSYGFYREGVADRMITLQQLQDACAAMPKLQLVCTGCLALAPADANIYLPWLQAQKKAGKTVAIDVNLRPNAIPNLKAYRKNALRALASADIIKTSDEDLRHLGYGVNATEAAQSLFQQLSAKILLLTLGAEGAHAFVRTGDTIQTLFAQECKSLRIADTIGAGDCFFAGFLSAWTEQPLNIEAALGRAIASASLNVQCTGCVPPTRTETLDWIQP